MLEAPVDKLFSKRHQLIVFGTGLLVLILLPVFKTVTGLPPFMGMLAGLGVLWIITEIMHGGREDKARNTLSVAHALQRIDVPSILFFLGILLSIASLEETGSLARLARWMSSTLRNDDTIVISIGLLSAVIDNVPLVAAAQGMYDLNRYPTDHYFWEFLAYCTGTGGSALIIGSAAGVAAMGMERISFFWYPPQHQRARPDGLLRRCRRVHFAEQTCVIRVPRGRIVLPACPRFTSSSECRTFC